MDHSELGDNFKNFRFKFIEPHEFDEVIRILEDYLYVSMVPLGYKPEHADDWNDFFLKMLKSSGDMSYMAVDTGTGEIAAIRMVDLVPKNRSQELPPFRHKANIDSFRCCGEICKDLNLFEQFGVNEYPDMFGLCTVAKYRQLGLATEMYRRGLNFMKKRGYKVVKCSFISPFTRRAGYKHGYEECAKRKFSECKNQEGNVLNPNADPDDFICFGVFDLTKRLEQ